MKLLYFFIIVLVVILLIGCCKYSSLPVRMDVNCIKAEFLPGSVSGFIMEFCEISVGNQRTCYRDLGSSFSVDCLFYDELKRQAKIIKKED